MDIHIVDTKKMLSCKDRTKVWQDILKDIIRRKFQNINPVIERDVYGKPFVANIEGCHFSISHSGRKIAIAIDVLPVGVDIEKIREVNFRVVDWFFSTEDIINFHKISKKDRKEHFFKMWTQKESYVKCIGMGFSRMPFREFTIVDDRLVGDYSGQYRFSTYDILYGYKMSVCRRNDTDINITYN